MFVPENPFQRSLILAFNYGAYLSEEPFDCKVGSWPYRRTLDKAGNACEGRTHNYSSLLRTFGNYGRKMFNNIGLTLERWARDRPIRSRDRHSNLIVSCKVTKKKSFVTSTPGSLWLLGRAG